MFNNNVNIIGGINSVKCNELVLLSNKTQRITGKKNKHSNKYKCSFILNNFYFQHIVEQ